MSDYSQNTTKKQPKPKPKLVGLFLLEWGLSPGLFLNVPHQPHTSPLTVPENLAIGKAMRECFTVSTESECVLHSLEHFLLTSKPEAWHWGSPIYHQPAGIVWKRIRQDEHLPSLSVPHLPYINSYGNLKCILLPFFLSKLFLLQWHDWEVSEWHERSGWEIPKLYLTNLLMLTSTKDTAYSTELVTHLYSS